MITAVIYATGVAPSDCAIDNQDSGVVGILGGRNTSHSVEDYIIEQLPIEQRTFQSNRSKDILDILKREMSLTEENLGTHLARGIQKHKESIEEYLHALWNESCDSTKMMKQTV